MHRNSGPSRLRLVPLLALPSLVLLLSFIVWVTAVSRSGFWADDFLNVTHFSRSLGNLSDDHINAGRYVTNVFFAIGTYAFGAGSVVPFLLLDTLVFAAGVALWLRVGSRIRWRPFDAWWVVGLFIATAVWYQTALDSSAIGHASGFLALGLGLWSHERCMSADTARAATLWSLACGAAWTLGLVSNILYVGLLPIAVYCSVHQVIKLRAFGVRAVRAALAVGGWNLVLPLVYFAAVAYPATTYKSQYASSGLQYIHQNLRFYRHQLAPTGVLAAAYIAVIVFALIAAVAAARRKDWFPLAVVSAAGATALPALVQSQQRAIFYLAMPLLLTFSGLAASLRPVWLSGFKHLATLRRALLLGAAAMLLLVFAQGAEVRSYFVTTPFGGTLAAFRSQVAALTPEGGAVCAKMNLDPAHQALFIAAMSGPDGFFIPPVSAAQAFLLAPGQPCPAQGGAATVNVSVNSRGDFVATR
jgi:hypothetical protein